MSQPTLICTAGHIDHGKSSMIRALTGYDPDRWKEEKERGITIDLGYAHLEGDVELIDVPGHEKFIRNMVAGAATVDYALLVIAADDGIMPQTREHFQILQILGVKGGLVALTKCDLVDEEWIDLVEDDVRQFLDENGWEKTPIVRIDSLSGKGIPELKEHLMQLAKTKQSLKGAASFRLPVDRVFTVKGFGTVVTGSVVQGSCGVGDELELTPNGKTVRVRGLQNHGKQVERVAAGMRAAMNLHPVSVEEVNRGTSVAEHGFLQTGSVFDAHFHLLSDQPPVKHRQQVRVHLGCADVLGRMLLYEAKVLEPGGEALCRIELEHPLGMRRQDRFVVRRVSPQSTLGGGFIIDPAPRAMKRKAEVLAILEHCSSDDAPKRLEGIVRGAGEIALKDLLDRSDMPEQETLDLLFDLELAERVVRFEQNGEACFAPVERVDAFAENCRSALESFHRKNPYRLGIHRDELLSRVKFEGSKKLVSRLLDLAAAKGLLEHPARLVYRLPGQETNFTKQEKNWLAEIETGLSDGGMTPPSPKELAQRTGAPLGTVRGLMMYLTDMGKAVALESDILLSRAALDEARRGLFTLLSENKSFSVSEYREAIGSSRKFVIPLLNRFDAEGLTLRNEDLRVKGKHFDRLVAEFSPEETEPDSGDD